MPEMPQSMQEKGLQNTQQDLTVSTSQLSQKISPKDGLLRLRIKTGYLRILITGCSKLRNKLSINYDIQAGHSTFAHSRPDKIGTPRLLPLYIRNIFNGISAKKSAQILCPAFLFEFVNNVQ